MFWVAIVPDLEQISPTVSFTFKPKLRWQAVRRNQMLSIRFLFFCGVFVLKFGLVKIFFLTSNYTKIFPTKKMEADMINLPFSEFCWMLLSNLCSRVD